MGGENQENSEAFLNRSFQNLNMLVEVVDSKTSDVIRLRGKPAERVAIRDKDEVTDVEIKSKTATATGGEVDESNLNESPFLEATKKENPNKKKSKDKDSGHSLFIYYIFKCKILFCSKLILKNK